MRRKDLFLMAGFFLSAVFGGLVVKGFPEPDASAKSIWETEVGDGRKDRKEVQAWVNPSTTSSGNKEVHSKSSKTWVYGDSAAWNTTGNAGTVAGTNFIGTTDNQAFDIRTNNTIRTRITSDGNVGIGTTSPAYKLDVRSTTADAIGIYSRLYATTGTNSYAIGAEQGSSSGTAYGVYSCATGAATTNIGGYFTASGATNNYGLIVANGNVGIGTDAPGYPLDVNGDSRIGWHGSATRIKLLPTDFRPSDWDAATNNGDIMSDGGYITGNGGAPTTLYASVPIPTGYKATHVRIYLEGTYGCADLWVREGDISTNAAILSTTLTDFSDAEHDINDVSSTGTNYLVLHLFTCTRNLRGAYVKIERM